MSHLQNIIVVEDDSDFRESLVEYLSLAGFSVAGVSSALEFYNGITRQSYQIVVLDIGLPDQNGLVLAEFIRNNTDMRIIMLTAQSSLDSKISAYHAGADIYLVKPVDLAELTASIRSLLGRIGAVMEPPAAAKGPAAAPSPAMAVEPGWTLSRHECSLLSPQGSKVSLTSKEFDFLEKLAASPYQVVERQELLKTLAYDNDELGNKALDALIHRLRRKKEYLDLRIPLKTIHGVGYSFAAPIEMV
ncbi:MAG: response regulator transcription factor [Chlorobiaceae bacterium]|nr:response regulator transcription factor [Chlorobiaceae bacterium]